MTRVGPEGWPSSTAEGNTEKAMTKFRQNEMAIPGTISGKRTLQKVCSPRGAQHLARLLEVRVDAGDVAQEHQEGVGETLEPREMHDAEVVVREAERAP